MRTSLRVLLATESLRAGGSGIGRVARLMARVLGEEAHAGRLSASGLALNDAIAATDLGMPIRAMGSSRLRFVAEVQRGALTHSHCMYDFAGMGRAHPRFWPLRRPYFTWIHGIEIWEDAHPSRLRVAQRADVIAVNSAYTRARADRLHGGFSRARVCWLGTDTDLDAAQPHAQPARPTVLILARIDRGGGYKGHAELIDAWPTVVSAVPDARLVIAGSGTGAKTVADHANRSTARASIELRGFVPEADVEALWAQSSVFAMPSRREGFGLAYIEAMRHGLPVIASVHDAATEINLEGVTGYNVNLAERDQLAERVIALLRDAELARSFGEAGRERWRTYFTYSAFKKRFLPVLDEFLLL